MKLDWRVPISLIVAWVVVFILAVETGFSVLRFLAPVILGIMLLYLVVCTVVVLFSNNSDTDKKDDSNGQTN